MQIDLYKKTFGDYFNSEDFNNQIQHATKLVNDSNNIFFIGNGGSNSICSHMYQDYGKIGRKKTYCFSDPSLITCYSNDYGYDKAIEEWLKIYFSEGDILISISSSGKSSNILNASKFVKTKQGNLITLSGFDSENPLRKMGNVNFHIPIAHYGIVECYHQVILHMILDMLYANK